MSKLFLVFLSCLLGALLFTSQTLPAYAVGAYEDYTTYTEVDPNTDITVATNTLTIDTMRRDVSAYVYKDKGAGHFSGDFEHVVDVKATASDDHGSVTIWALADSVNDVTDALAVGDLIHILFYQPSEALGLSIWLREWYSGSNYDDKTYLISMNTWYYLTIDRISSVLRCRVYLDSARTSLLDALQITVHSTPAYRYVYGVMSETSNFAPTATMSCEVKNLGLDLDFVYPTFNLIGLNSTLNASGIQFTINLSDNVALDTCLLEWNNTGTSANVSYSLSGTTYLLLANQTLHATEAVRIYYRFFFNDSSGNMNVTVQHFLITNTEPIIGPPPPGLSSAQLFVGVMVIVGSIVFVGYLASKK